VQLDQDVAPAERRMSRGQRLRAREVERGARGCLRVESVEQRVRVTRVATPHCVRAQVRERRSREDVTCRGGRQQREEEDVRVREERCKEVGVGRRVPCLGDAAARSARVFREGSGTRMPSGSPVRSSIQPSCAVHLPDEFATTTRAPNARERRVYSRPTCAPVIVEHGLNTAEHVHIHIRAHRPSSHVAPA
jgi:hypothetical protein